MIEAVKLEADIYPAGPRGLSAYEIYKKEGGQLSEEEWLKSLNGLTPTIGENGNWFLGTVDTGLPSRGPKGDTGSIKFIVVTELPTENIDETAIYLKPVESPTGENKFEELIYVNGKWEDLGTPNVAVDLSNYYTKEEIGALTDLSTEDKSSIVNAINEVANSNDGRLLTLNMSITTGINIYSGEPIEKCSELINNLYKIGEKNVCILFYNQRYTNTFRKNCLMSLYQDASQQSTLYEFTGLVNGTGNGYDTIIQGMKLIIAGTWDNNIFTANRVMLTNDNDAISMPRIDSKFLSKTNTTSYTPTSNYHPATKKYVDDNKSKVPTFISALLPEYSANNETSSNITNETELASLSDIINNFYKEGIASASLFVGNSNTTSSAILFSRGQVLNAKVKTYRFWGIMSGWDSYILRLGISLIVKGTWTDDVFTCISAYFQTGTKYQLNSFAQKSYVDDLPTTYAGYDATKTQVLKNINGTLTWVDEV